MTTPAQSGGRLPVLGLLLHPDPPEAFSHLVRALMRWCEPRHSHPATDDAQAWLASSSKAPGVNRLAAQPDARLAVWSGDGSLTLPQTEVSLAFPVDGFDVSAIPAMGPFLRQRWRRRESLPTPLIVVAGAAPANGGESRFPKVEGELVPTGLALASCVVAHGRVVVEALAWGAPVVTDARSAGQAGATPGRDVVVADGAEIDEVALALATDERRAAELSRHGRRLAEDRYDHQRPARQLARLLGIIPTVDLPARVESVLDDLGTPLAAPIRQRARELVGQR